MLRTTVFLLLRLFSGTVHADVLDDEFGLVMPPVHQTLGAHHLPYMLIVIVAGAIAYRSGCIAGK